MRKCTTCYPGCITFLPLFFAARVSPFKSTLQNAVASFVVGMKYLLALRHDERHWRLFEAPSFVLFLTLVGYKASSSLFGRSLRNNCFAWHFCKTLIYRMLIKINTFLFWQPCWMRLVVLQFRVSRKIRYFACGRKKLRYFLMIFVKEQTRRDWQ